VRKASRHSHYATLGCSKYCCKN